MCQMRVGRNFQKCEAGAFYFLFYFSRLCPDVFVVTRPCQCVHCLFFCMCPNVGALAVAGLGGLSNAAQRNAKTDLPQNCPTTPNVI